MKLSIIPCDNVVCEDGVCYMNLTWEGTPPNVHALQWDNGSGWIEYNDGTPNEDIDVLPIWAGNAELAWAEANIPIPPQPPTAEENKQTAMNKLRGTDWVNQPDVRDTSLSPHLVNVAEFDAYRLAIRQIAVFPTAGDLVWPEKPAEVWA
jgi:hypothetical protein